MERITLFADILLPLPIEGAFTYRVPYEINQMAVVGQRVVVQFGKKKIYTGLIKKIHQTPPKGFEAKYVLSVLDEKPVVNDVQFKFWEWLATYYMCSEGDVMNAPMPSAMKLSSETKILLNDNFNKDYSVLNDKEYLITEALEIKNILTISEVEKITGQLKVVNIIKSLIDKGVATVEEEIIDYFKPKTEAYVRFTDEYNNDEEKLKNIFDTLNKKAFKQLELLMAFIELSKKYSEDEPRKVVRSALLAKANATHSQLNSLIEKGVLEIYSNQISRLKIYENIKNDFAILNEWQQKASDEITESYKTKDIVLLHGITSSGKTELYIRLIDEAISQGKQVLYLLPEIALTTQIINRLRKHFANDIGVYHSKFNKNERAEIWNNLNATDNPNRYKIILGARSAIFLPFSNLGLVIVDEEHDYSYKQNDPAPRYHARDSAIYLALLHKAKTLLGSATPSLETYFNATTNKYGLVEINQRYGEILLPTIQIVDIKKETLKKQMKSHFSKTLIEQIGLALQKHEQVILFQNRRGFSLRVECDTCGWMPHCKYCDVTLTYHKHYNQLRCHYCGYSIKIPEQCPECRNTGILMKGFGTEKLEDELPIFFPNAKIARMDLDTTRNKTTYQQIIYDFEDRKTDILIGTQMVTKGLDFDHVSLVGILNADNMLNFPDFRAFERSYQLIAQVSGRAGRKNKQGLVIIQSFHPNHPVLNYALQNSYSAMFESQILERQKFKYPPFYRLIKLTLKHKDIKLIDEAAVALAKMLRKIFDKRILGPEHPIVSRIKSYYLKNILFKLEKDIHIQQMKTELMKQIRLFNQKEKYKSVKVVIDVDPF